ncbi:MAG: antitermination protein NusB, partial [Desulfovibrio sp.]|nr:antitermination protein NusB [Desulfovibrio sp.]
MAGPHSRRLLQRLKPSARKAALETILLVDEGQPVQQALSQVLDSGGLDERARRQATDLAYTALRTQARCAFVVERLLPRPEKLPPLFKACLGLAAGAMLFEEHAPVHALVHETVEDVRALFGKGLDRVANGALRSLQRLGSAPLERDFYRLKPSDAEIDVDARFYSLPRRIVRLWRTELGPERAVRLMERSFRRPCAGIRINRAKAGWEQVRQELLEAGAERLPGDACDLPCVFFREGGTGRLGRERMAALAASGTLSLQAAGSMWALHALGLFEQEAPLWDACAGFG